MADPNELGDLGKGTFSYTCVNNADSTCQVPESTLPFAVAVGGRFNVKFTAKNGSFANVDIPTKSLVAKRETGFEVIAAGLHPLVAIDGLGRAIDFRHVHGKDIAEVRLGANGDSAQSSLQLDVGKTVTLGAFAFDDEQVQLRGSIPFSWSGDASLTIEAPSADGKVQVTARVAGSTTIVLTVGNKTFSVSVRVGGKGPTPPLLQLDAGSPTELDASVLTDDAEVADHTDGGAP